MGRPRKILLAGRTLTGGFIAGPLMLNNLSTEQMVGLNGSTFTNGSTVMAWVVIDGSPQSTQVTEKWV